MASSPPRYKWRLTRKLKKPIKPKFFRLLFRRSDLPYEVEYHIVIAFSVLLVSWLLALPFFPSYNGIVSLLIAMAITGTVVVLWVRHTYHYNIDTYKNELKEYQEKLHVLKQKHPFPIIGHEQFRRSVEEVLDELQTRAPHRYREVLQYFPKAEYKSNLTYPNDENKEASGRSDGYFSVDGSGDNSKQVNTYERFRFVFLHEVGHNVEYRDDESAKGKEKTANRYANKALVEMGVLWGISVSSR